jgi:POT family proton-dependent oligopeptide transporter
VATGAGPGDQSHSDSLFCRFFVCPLSDFESLCGGDSPQDRRGLFLTAAAFSISALIEAEIQARTSSAAPKLNISWQLLAYVVMTAAEVMVYLTGLEFSYTQAPKRMKSFVMALYLLSVSAGNLLTAGVNKFMIRGDGTSRLEGASYYWFFTILMLVAAVIFVAFASRYRGQTYIQDEADASDSVG